MMHVVLKESLINIYIWVISGMNRFNGFEFIHVLSQYMKYYDVFMDYPYDSNTCSILTYQQLEHVKIC